MVTRTHHLPCALCHLSCFPSDFQRGCKRKNPKGESRPREPLRCSPEVVAVAALVQPWQRHRVAPPGRGRAAAAAPISRGDYRSFPRGDYPARILPLAPASRLICLGLQLIPSRADTRLSRDSRAAAAKSPRCS